MTAASLLLMAEFIDSSHRRQLPELRTRLSKDAVLEASHMAQLVLALEADLADDGVITRRLSEGLLAGDENLQMELQLALTERSTKFQAAQITLVGSVLKKHHASNADKFKQETEKKAIAAGELEKEEYELMKAQVLSLGLFL